MGVEAAKVQIWARLVVFLIRQRILNRFFSRNLIREEKSLIRNLPAIDGASEWNDLARWPSLQFVYLPQSSLAKRQ